MPGLRTARPTTGIHYDDPQWVRPFCFAAESDLRAYQRVFPRSLALLDSWPAVEECLLSKWAEVETRFPRRRSCMALMGNRWFGTPSHEAMRRHRFGEAPDVRRTIEHLWTAHRTGVFVCIRQGALRMFVPFCNVDFVHPSPDSLVMPDVDAYYALKRRFFRRERVLPKHRWWTNGHLVCNELPRGGWGESFLLHVKHLLMETCAAGGVPDVDLVFNKRDAALMGPSPPAWHLPVLSFYTGPAHADLALPCAEDVERAFRLFFPPSGGSTRFPAEGAPWAARTPKAVFRGSCTGAGTTPSTNQRLWVALRDGPLLDAKLTNWNLRDKIDPLDGVIRHVRPDAFPELDVGRQHHLSQRVMFGAYRAVLVIEGHSAAGRLGNALASGAWVVAVEPSAWNTASETWLTPMLGEMAHVVRAPHTALLDRLPPLLASPPPPVDVDAWLCAASMLEYTQLALAEAAGAVAV